MIEIKSAAQRGVAEQIVFEGDGAELSIFDV